MDNSDTVTGKTINFIILGCSFYLSCFLFSIQVESNLIIQTFLYACVVLLAVAIGNVFCPLILPLRAGL